MSTRSILLGVFLLAATPLFTASAAGADADTATVAARWQKHELQFDFSGFTTYYTCDGLEDKVRRVLLHFGARKGVKVYAAGCPGGPNKPTQMAWVKVQFESLAVAGSDSVPDTVPASWQPLVLNPKRPFEMGYGECELVHNLKPVLTAAFALQELEYQTSCVPHQVSLGDYNVKAKVLMPLPAK